MILRYEHDTFGAHFESARYFIVDSWNLVLRFDMIHYFKIFEIYFSWLQQ